jgi:iron complex outermembrane receptor protein
VDFDRQVYGGLLTSDPTLVALQRSVLAPQAYATDVDDTNVSGQITAAYQVAAAVNAYATYATSFKSVGLNLAGVPDDAAGHAVLAAAVVRPEDERHLEAGLKTTLLPGVTANVTAFQTVIDDYQAQVVNADVGVLRGYLANADRVRVRGLEVDGGARIRTGVSLYTAIALTDGIYVSFPDAPPPLEATGGPASVDISGSALPGISRWAFSLGGEYSHPAALARRPGDLFVAIDSSYRSSFSSSATASRYLAIDGYGLLNARVGFRRADAWTISLWSRNLLDTDYYELLSAAPGGSGLYVGLPGDPRTVGLTVRMSFR